MPAALSGKQIRQLASGGRHIALCTEDGEVYAWGRGVAGCLGVGATGCTGHPMPMRALALGKVQILTLTLTLTLGKLKILSLSLSLSLSLNPKP